MKDVFSKARLGATAILGRSCENFDFDAVALSGACRRLVRQSTCYGINAASYYGKGVVNYGMLAEDVPNIEALGNLACSDAVGCYNQVKAAIQACMDDNENFVAETIEDAELAYKQNFAQEVADFAEQNSGTFFGDLATMARNRFTSAADIKAFLEDVITDDVVEDAKAAAGHAADLAQAWCDEGCTSKSADFLIGIFNAMNDGENCTNAAVFCGDCQDSAAEYFKSNALPCCVENVVQKGIDAYNYVKDNYEERITAYRDQIQAGLTDTAIAEASTTADKVTEQFECVKAVYNGEKPPCVSESA